MEFAWLKEWAGQGIAVVVCLVMLWFAYRSGRAVWGFWIVSLWPAAHGHIQQVNNTLATLGTNETRQTTLMESMNGQIQSHTDTLQKHGEKLEHHGQLLQEIHQVVRKPQ